MRGFAIFFFVSLIVPAQVEDNLEVLTEILETEELKDFVEHLTQRIYVELDEFVHVSSFVQ